MGRVEDLCRQRVIWKKMIEKDGQGKMRERIRGWMI